MYAAKRLIGRSYDSPEVASFRQLLPYELAEGPNNDVRVRVAGRVYTIPEISGIVLREMKREGRIRYIGITTSHGRRHDELLQAMQKTDFDFVQFTYGLHDRDAESRLLPLAAERRMAVIANRPFDGGALFGRVQGKPLPGWAAGIDCANWAQFFLKFVVSHPAVTCAIPATSNPAHMLENMGAHFGRLPDAALRIRMARYFDSL
mgnify:CR=1 FL=1